MGFETRNLRVFLSSSMAEFRTHRAAVKQELDSLGIPNFVFEREGASDQSPAEIFQTAVRGASAYIGVFGKICGKYTREEFEMARGQKIACHLYVQHLRDEERSEELKDFLKSLSGVSDVPTVYYFQSTDELVAQIKRDLWAWSDQLAGRENLAKDQIDVRDKLAVLCDRDRQEVQFAEAVVSYFQVRSTRPLLLILPGPVQEKHDYYLNRVEWSSLERYVSRLTNHLNKEEIKGEKRVVRSKKSPCAMTTVADLRREILELLQWPETGDDGVIITHIKKAKLIALLIEIRLYASHCKGNPHKPFQLIADYLASFPDTKESVLVGVVVSLAEDEMQGWWKRWLGGDPFQKSIEELEERYRGGSKLLVKVLPRLTSPRRADVRIWLGDEKVKPKVPRKPEEEIIEAIFQGRDSLPMDDLYMKLTDLLEERSG